MAIVDNYLTKDKAKNHFLFFYYLLNNKLDSAAKLYMNLDPKISKHLGLLEILLKSDVKRLPSAAAKELLRKYNFLNDLEEGVMQNEEFETIMEGDRENIIQETTQGKNEPNEMKKNKAIANSFGFNSNDVLDLMQRESLQVQEEKEIWNSSNLSLEEISNIGSKKQKYSFNFSSKV